jgi:hypothetical protein
MEVAVTSRNVKFARTLSPIYCHMSSIGAGARGFGPKYRGDHLQIKLGQKRQPMLQDRKDIKSQQHTTNDPTV